MTSKEVNQEIFDRVTRHLLTQRKRAEFLYNCCYRTEEGLKCAIGCLIPDDEYTPQMESLTVCAMLVRFPKALGEALTVDKQPLQDRKLTLDLLSRLQRVHDRYSPSQWPTSLREVAKDLALSSHQVSLMEYRAQDTTSG